MADTITTSPSSSAPAAPRTVPHPHLWQRPVSQLSRTALSLAIVCAVAALISGPGYRLGAWGLAPALLLLRWSAYGAIAAAVIAIAGIAVTRKSTVHRGFGNSLAALVIAVATFAVPGALVMRAKQAPPIHDISTDRDDPPPFVAVLLARNRAPNASTYGGPDVAVQQGRAYPDIVPFESALPPDAMFRRALAASSNEGWRILAAVPAEGRIEATDTTFFFGFQDDVVIRVRPSAKGSRVDVRSVSRVGESDLGGNARRVRGFIARLQRD